MKAVSSALPGPTPKRCELPLFFAVHHWKALDLGSLNMQFQQDWPKDRKNYSSSNFLTENLKKFSSTDLHGGPLQGSTIRTLFESH